MYDPSLHPLVDINGKIRRQLWKLRSIHTWRVTCQNEGWRTETRTNWKPFWRELKMYDTFPERAASGAVRDKTCVSQPWWQNNFCSVPKPCRRREREANKCQLSVSFFHLVLIEGVRGRKQRLFCVKGWEPDTLKGRRQSPQMTSRGRVRTCPVIYTKDPDLLCFPIQTHACTAWHKGTARHGVSTWF